MTTPTFPSSLNLDARRLGMLEAMGIPYGWPTSAPLPAPVAAPSPPTRHAIAVAKKSEEFESKKGAAYASKLSIGNVIDFKKIDKKQEQPAPHSVPASHEVGERPRPEAWDWDALEQGVRDCHACGLCHSRRQAVLGMGPRRAKWMVVGEGPGEQEDRQGVPFVGPAGQLLDAMLAAMGLSRERDVYITNAVKCRPPSNRNPEPHEWQQCQPYLMRQIELVQPELILSLGRYASHTLLDHVVPQAASSPLGRLRGQVHRLHDRPVIVSYHPAYLLRNPPEKAKVWQDLCLAMSQINHNPLSDAAKTEV